MPRILTLAAVLAITPAGFAQKLDYHHADDVPMHHMAAGGDKPLLPCTITPPGEYGIRGNYQANTWPGGIVPYTFGADVEEINRLRTRQALDELESVANLTFVERDQERDFVTYINAGQNSSPVGQVGGQQIIRMFNWEARAVIQHETFHSLGVWHEQQRPDRDQYVTVNFANIEFENRFNYDIPPGATAFGDYDFESIMHYGQCFFVACNNCPNVACRAMTVLPPNEEFQDVIGNRGALSQGDIELMQFLYGRPTIDNDDCTTPTAISLDQVISESNDVALTFGESSCIPSGADAWYAYTPPFTDRFRVSTCGSSFDTVLSIHSGCPGDTSTEITCNNDNFFVCGAGTSSSLTLELTEGVEYLIRVAGVNGDLGDYNLTVNVAPPVNDECDAAVILFGDNTYEFNNTYATTDGLADALCGGTSKQIEKDVWYSWTAGTTGNVEMSLCGQTTIDSNVAVYRNVNCPVGTQTLVCDDDGCGGLQSNVFWTAQAGETFLIRIGSYEGTPGGTGTFTISTGPPLDNNDCADALAISGDGSFPFDIAVATTDGAPDSACSFFDEDQIENDVWYAWTAGADGTATIETCDGTVVDTKMAVYLGFACETGTPLACSEDDCALQTRLTIDVSEGEQYLLRIGTFPGADVGNGSFTITTTLLTGACCTGSICTITNERDCTAAGGSYLGDGAVCDFELAGEPALINGTVTEAVIGPNPANDEITDTITLENPPEQIGAVTVTVDLAHDFIEDVEIDLTHVASGTTIRLFEDQCLEFEDLVVSLTFDDNGADFYDCMSPVATIKPVPSGAPLSTFLGFAGDTDWTLTVRDDFLDGEGTLFSWSMTVDGIGQSICNRPELVIVDASGAGDVTSIQEAIDLVAAGGEIIVNPGIYRELLDFRGKAFDLHSVDPADPAIVDSTIISADIGNNGISDGRVITATGGESEATRVRGFTIRDGNALLANGEGGGIYLNGSGLTVEDCTFVSNRAARGACIAAVDQALGSDVTINITRCRFINGNTTDSTGGVYANPFNGSVNIGDSVFTGNLNGATLIGAGTLTIDNSLVWGNTGAAIVSIAASNILVNDSTIGFNAGDGIRTELAANRVAQVRNTIVWGNTAGEINTGGGAFLQPDVAYSLVEGGFSGTGNVDADPLFAEPFTGDFSLTAGSAAIDAGDNTAVPSEITTDLAGNPRYADDTGIDDTGVGTAPIVDIGAYEFQGTTVIEPTCLCEFADAAEVSVLDLLAFLEFWFVDAPEADLNDDEQVTVLDLLDFLECWFNATGNGGVCE